jgi:hypothetical protein
MEKMHRDSEHNTIVSRSVVQRAITWPRSDPDTTPPKVGADEVNQKTKSTADVQEAVKHEESLFSRMTLAAVKYTFLTLAVYALVVFFGSSNVHTRFG